MKFLPNHACILVVSIAAVGFALTAHRPGWIVWRGASLSALAGALAVGWASLSEPLRITFGRFRRRAAGLKTAALVSGAVAVAVLYRILLGASPWPATLGWFALPAAGIGAAEEVLWRGWMQGALGTTLGPCRAVFLSAGSHAAYKAALFMFPPEGVPSYSWSALLVLGGLTFCFGIALGGFRAREGSTFPPMAAHAVFDVLVYGHASAVPWWVW